MKKVVMVLMFFFSSALASAISTRFFVVEREVNTIVINGKLLAEIGGLSYAFGFQYTIDGTRISANVGTKNKTTIQAVKNGNLGWYYVDPVQIGKNLGYKASIEKVTNPKTKVVEDILEIEYAQKITCNDFKTWEDAQQFFRASSGASVIRPNTNFTNKELDPYNLDRSKDGLACEFLPHTR